MEINIVAVVISAFVPFFLGYLWYTMIFNKPWMQEIGMKEGTSVPASAIQKQLIGSFIQEILMAVILSIILGSGADASRGAFIGFLMGVTAALVFGVNYLFEGKTLRHWGINAGYNIILFTIMGIIIGAM